MEVYALENFAFFESADTADLATTFACPCHALYISASSKEKIPRLNEIF